MSVVYSSHTVLGIVIREPQLKTSRQVPGCSHQHASKFCPSCGAPARKTLKEMIDLEDGLPDGINIFTLGYDSSDVVIGAGIIVNENDELDVKAFDDSNLVCPQKEVKNRLQCFLDPKGLWDQNGFKLWCFLSAS